MSAPVDLALERARRGHHEAVGEDQAPKASGLSEFIEHEDLLRRMVQSLWRWLVFVERETAGAVLLEAGFSEYEVKRFADRAFALLLLRRRVARRSA